MIHFQLFEQFHDGIPCPVESCLVGQPGKLVQVVRHSHKIAYDAASSVECLATILASNAASRMNSANVRFACLLRCSNRS